MKLGSLSVIPPFSKTFNVKHMQEVSLMVASNGLKKKKRRTMGFHSLGMCRKITWMQNMYSIIWCLCYALFVPLKKMLSYARLPGEARLGAYMWMLGWRWALKCSGGSISNGTVSAEVSGEQCGSRPAVKEPTAAEHQPHDRKGECVT